MVVGVCTLEILLPGNRSLKGKRSVIKSLLARVRQEFNVSAAEIDSHDNWQLATLGLATISTSATYAHGLLERSVQWIGETRPDVEILEYQIDWY